RTRGVTERNWAEARASRRNYHPEAVCTSHWVHISSERQHGRARRFWDHHRSVAAGQTATRVLSVHGRLKLCRSEQLCPGRLVLAAGNSASEWSNPCWHSAHLLS